ncbi:hypothetical protein MicloDRAFT_00063660 [Microvirga lotononidis]|uniref:Uncharacterized protein n=1 Tax=Microvirga lotononidis TaxID=864069 RepID=I4YNU7_9HYPH|nr:hypothetical protein MicloDRAFT_00063660 [Microvirga lotononidis]
MTFDGSHRTSISRISHDRAPRRFGLPLVPTLLGALAIMNVASVVLVLME